MITFLIIDVNYYDSISLGIKKMTWGILGLLPALDSCKLSHLMDANQLSNY